MEDEKKRRKTKKTFFVLRRLSPGVPRRVREEAGVNLGRRGHVDEPVGDAELFEFGRFLGFGFSGFVAN